MLPVAVLFSPRELQCWGHTERRETPHSSLCHLPGGRLCVSLLNFLGPNITTLPDEGRTLKSALLPVHQFPGEKVRGTAGEQFCTVAK